MIAGTGIRRTLSQFRAIAHRFMPMFLALLLPALGQAGPLQRSPNTTLQMPPALPVYGYSTANALGSMTFNYPVCIASPPGETNRLFILEKQGLIIVITN